MKRPKQRFRLLEFTNPRTGSVSWRVSGMKRDGTRIRENYLDAADAQARQIELEAEFFAKETDVTLRSTRLTDTQVRLAELAFAKLDHDEDILRAVQYWRKQGKQLDVAESPTLDDAAKAFKEWLESTETLRDRTKSNLRLRVSLFTDSTPNLRVADVTPDTIEAFISKRRASAATKDNDRRALSRFFGWCIERPRRWCAVNPCREVRVERGELPPPAVLTVDDCKKLLKAAQGFKAGRLVPYLAVCLFAGLRPFEASRLDWKQVNLADGEIRLEGNQTKTGRPRVVSICPTLRAWLESCQGGEFYPTNWRKDFDEVKRLAGFGTGLKEWPDDVLRHTAISFYFRRTGSYGQTAEQFGNSEAIIKRHYQGRVSSEDATRFYNLRP